MKISSASYNLRSVISGDENFLYRVYASTRAEEMKLVDWSDAQKESFLKMQFDAQTEHYRIHYPPAEYFIIEHDGKSLGRLTLERSAKSLLIMDITLLPEYRNAGTGTAILMDLMEEAQRAGVPVVLRVEFFNPVIRLYNRLGFVKTREVNSVYHEMIWKPLSN